MLIGETISNYRILKELGGGGTGVVYEAEDLVLRRHVALKFLPDHLAKSTDALKRFQSEARSASGLNHPNICAIHKFGEHEGRPFIVMEFINGQTLKQLIDGKPMEIDRGVDLGIQIVDALDAAHKEGIIHRDISSTNIFVTERGIAKLLDFGLEPSTEQPIDARNDLFSFGVVLYEMVSASVNSEVPPGLREIVTKTLQKDPNERYQSAAELLCDLQRLKHDSSTAKSSVQPILKMSRQGRVYFGIGIAFVILAVIAGLWLNNKKPVPTIQSNSPSIAVLPFVNMSADKDQDFFSDGLTEELLDNLAKIRGLHVTGRTSSFQFKGKKEDLRVIAKKLNVANILEGSVRKEGNRVRINAQLISAADGFHLWSETYDRELNDIFAVQEEIARNVAEALKVKLLDQKTSLTKNADAYNAYLQGRYFNDRFTAENLQKAITYYQKAIEIDPNYAPAWTGLARVHRIQANRGEMPYDEGYRKAREEVEKALMLDENLAIAHAEKGWIKRSYDWDWSGAEASFQRALQLEPGNATIIRGTGVVLSTLGRFDKAIEMTNRALELDPLSPLIYNNLGLQTYYAQRYEESSAAFKKALELNPELPEIHVYLCRVYLFQSRTADAFAEITKEENVLWQSYGNALAYHAAGKKKEADSALKELIEEYQDRSAFQIAQVHAFRGEVDQAFQWLERAYTQRESDLTYVKGDPLLKNLKNDPRYPAFLMKMRLPVNK